MNTSIDGGISPAVCGPLLLSLTMLYLPACSSNGQSARDTQQATEAAADAPQGAANNAEVDKIGADITGSPDSAASISLYKDSPSIAYYSHNGNADAGEKAAAGKCDNLKACIDRK